MHPQEACGEMDEVRTWSCRRGVSGEKRWGKHANLEVVGFVAEHFGSHVPVAARFTSELEFVLQIEPRMLVHGEGLGQPEVRELHHTGFIDEAVAILQSVTRCRVPMQRRSTWPKALTRVRLGPAQVKSSWQARHHKEA